MKGLPPRYSLAGGGAGPKARRGGSGKLAQTQVSLSLADWKKPLSFMNLGFFICELGITFPCSAAAEGEVMMWVGCIPPALKKIKHNPGLRTLHPASFYFPTSLPCALVDLHTDPGSRMSGFES